MKTSLLITSTLIATLLAPTAFAQQKMDDMKGMDMSKKPAGATPVAHAATGVVKKIDTQSGVVVTIAHEPIPSVNWPAMTMGFVVKDTMLLDKLSIGKKVDFQFVKESGSYVVTSVK